MSKHTPGPWTLEYHPSSGKFTGDVLAPNGSEVCTTWSHAQHGNMFDKEANACLIAAAPELLEDVSDAAQHLMMLLRTAQMSDLDRETTEVVRDQLLAAIAKAEGRSDETV